MILLTLLLLALQVTQVAGSQEEVSRIPIEKLLSQRDLQKYYKEPKYHNKLKLLRSNLEAREKLLYSAVGGRTIVDIYRTLAEIRGLAHHSLNLSMEEKNTKELRHKEVKKLEIRLRKLCENLEDQKMNVPLENRSYFDQTKEVVEELRDQLLRQLFGQAIGKIHAQGTTDFAFTSAGASFLAASNSTSQRGLWDLDKFTEEEFEKIQVSRRLDKRLNAFFEIAERRLDEIERRREGREWEEEEPNPLEFFTWEDMLFGYTRAVDGVMSNIDSHAETQSSSIKDIKKALKKLKEKMEEYKPRLETLLELVEKERDQSLYEQYQEALKSSEVAYKGANYGLSKLPD